MQNISCWYSWIRFSCHDFAFGDINFMKPLLHFRWKHYTSVVHQAARQVASALKLVVRFYRDAFSVATGSLCAGTLRVSYSGVAALIDAVSAMLRITDDSTARHTFLKTLALGRHLPQHAESMHSLSGRVLTPVRKE